MCRTLERMAAPTIARPAVAPTASRPRPVFVDDRGVRARRLRYVGRGLAMLAVAYLAMLVAGLAGASWVPPVALPGIGPVVPGPAPATAPHLGARSVPLPRTVVTSPARAARTTATTTRATSQAGTTATTGPSSAPGQTQTTNGRGPKTTTPTTTATTVATSSASQSGTTTTTINHGQTVSSGHSRAPRR